MQERSASVGWRDQEDEVVEKRKKGKNYRNGILSANGVNQNTELV